MGNPITKKIHTGTIGELLVQLRLLEFGIQSASPIKDSGNDLIAIKGEVVKFVQVKTSQNIITRIINLPKIYHVVALVELKYSDEGKILLDRSKIFVYIKGENLSKKRELTKKAADNIWQN